MEMDQGKLFIGGISWDTNEERLREYFGAYGEVAEAVIMRDRTTGRARGFGFVVFSDPTAAERVVKEKHMIDGRTVEAKRAVPRDDQQLINRTSGSIQGSPSPGRTKKIFVGGLASTVTESDFQNYFDQFGNITDVVVMFDHNTKRPRGFGFITYDSEEAVDRVLYKSFHELNGKMVEVKRAVPKEPSSPVPNRGPLLGYNYSFGRSNNFLNSYPPGYGLRMDGQYSPLASARAAAYAQFGSTYGLSVNMEQGLNAGFGGGSSFSGNYGRVMSPYFSSNQSRYNTPIGSSRSDSFFDSSSRNMWGNGNLNNSSNNTGSSSYFGTGNGAFGPFRNDGANWGVSPIIGGSSSAYGAGNSYGFGRNGGGGVATPSSFSAASHGHEGPYGGFLHNGTVYGDPTWQSSSSELDNSGTFGYGLGNSEDVIAAKDSEDYVVGYDLPNRKSSRGAPHN